MKVTYIHHSGFAVELNSCILLFDYFKGNLPKFDKSKKIYVFASHSHSDHFNPVIFNLESEYDNVKYILSDDIKFSESDNITFIGANQNIAIDELKIETLESSDLGVAFIVEVEGERIYHAGDLNWWHWEGEPQDENKSAEFKFKKEIERIKGRYFDIAFLPLDPRQEEQYYLGFNEFMKSTNTKIAFPMHFWEDYSIVDVLKKSEYSTLYKDRIIKISKENEEFNII